MTGRTSLQAPWLRIGRIERYVLIQLARSLGVALAVIALPNDASEGLHRSFGFEKVGVLPEVGHKLGRWIDTAFYALPLAESPTRR